MLTAILQFFHLDSPNISAQPKPDSSIYRQQIFPEWSDITLECFYSSPVTDITASLTKDRVVAHWRKVMFLAAFNDFYINNCVIQSAG
jgi:hypothetical protein